VCVKIDVSQIESEPFGFSEQLVLPPDRLDADQVVGPMTVRLEGQVVQTVVGLRAQGSCTAEGSVACIRCLSPIPWSATEDFDLELRQPAVAPVDDELALDEADLDVIFVEDGTLDTDDLAAEQVMLALPMRAVCSDDCAGLCPTCGANRNIQGACRCEPEPDPRWDGLRGLTGNSA
jgi:uncharacterized protein